MIFNRIYAVISILLFLAVPVVYALGVLASQESADRLVELGLGPLEMANAIKQSQTATLFATVAPLMLYGVALFVFPIAIWLIKCHDKWFYWSAWPVTIFFVLPFIPIGTILAIFIIVHLVRNKAAYYQVSAHKK